MPKGETLKNKERKIRATFLDGLALRVHRSISWLARAWPAPFEVVRAEL
jgi:hypothetical protein